MSSDRSFTCFGALPKELRLLIWDQAFVAEWTLLAVRNTTANEHHTRIYVPFNMAFLGPAPYIIGLSCKEAWQHMRKSHAKLVLKQSDPNPPVPSVYWIAPERTVLYVDCLIDRKTSDEVLENFDEEGLGRIEHIGLLLHPELFYTFEFLARRCPMLRTVIVKDQFGTFRFHPSPIDARLFAEIAANKDAGLREVDKAMANCLPTEVPMPFRDPRPEVLVLPFNCSCNWCRHMH